MPRKADSQQVALATKTLGRLSILAAYGLIDLRFGDETAFSLTSNIPYGWNPINEQQGIKCRKGGNLNVFGLLDVHHGCLRSYTTLGRVDTAQVIDWLDDFANALSKPTVVVLDNAPWHKSEAFMVQLPRWQNQQLFIYHIPAYSPHLNLIEIAWRMMKYHWLRPEDFECKQTLHEQINYILTHFQEPEFEIDFTAAVPASKSNLKC